MADNKTPVEIILPDADPRRCEKSRDGKHCYCSTNAPDGAFYQYPPPKVERVCCHCGHSEAEEHGPFRRASRWSHPGIMFNWSVQNEGWPLDRRGP